MQSSITVKHQPWESSLNLPPPPQQQSCDLHFSISSFLLITKATSVAQTITSFQSFSFISILVCWHPYPLYPQSQRTWLWGNHPRGPHCQAGYLIQPSPLHTRLQPVDHVLISDAASGLLPWVSHPHFRSPLRGSNHFREEGKLVAMHNQYQAVVLLYHDLLFIEHYYKILILVIKYCFPYLLGVCCLKT